MRVKKTAAFLLILILLVATALPGGATVNATSDRNVAHFKIGASSSEMIEGGGKLVSISDGTYYLNDSGQLVCGTDVLTEGNLSCLNIIENDVFFVRHTTNGRYIAKLSLNDGAETEIIALNETSVKEMYVVRQTGDRTFVESVQGCRGRSLLRERSPVGFRNRRDRREISKHIRPGKHLHQSTDCDVFV